MINPTINPRSFREECSPSLLAVVVVIPSSMFVNAVAAVAVVVGVLFVVAVAAVVVIDVGGGVWPM